MRLFSPFVRTYEHRLRHIVPSRFAMYKCYMYYTYIMYNNTIHVCCFCTDEIGCFITNPVKVVVFLIFFCYEIILYLCKVSTASDQSDNLMCFGGGRVTRMKGNGFMGKERKFVEIKKYIF